jgi:hypothetical protein
VWFVGIGVTVYVGHCKYFRVMRFLKNVMCGCWCYCICGTLQALQCSEVTEKCGLWLLVLLHMWDVASTSF